jgi:hypothetical protein
MKAVISLFNSEYKTDEDYWDVAQAEKIFQISIKDTGATDWGGEHIYEVEGTEEMLNKFAQDFCSADSIVDLHPAQY